MDELYNSLIQAINTYVGFNHIAANAHDVVRAAVNAGYVSAYLNVVRALGHEVDEGHRDDDGCLRVSYVRIDGKYIRRDSKPD